VEHQHVRQRGAPLDLIVAEAMILANSTWGQWLAEHGVPGIYRSQASLAPGVKVRMGTKALPHAGIGVKSYAWSTSPLRRYTDLVNQWQIIACARHGRTAALAAPFKPKDAELFSIISGFDAAYSAYNGQPGRHGALLDAQVPAAERHHRTRRPRVQGRPGARRHLPLVLPVLGTGDLPRGARVRVKLGEIDLITWTCPAPCCNAPGCGIRRAEAVGEDDSEDEMAAGPIAIAVDVTDTSEAEAGAAARAG
jgi:exoribonuclease-2